MMKYFVILFAAAGVTLATHSWRHHATAVIENAQSEEVTSEVTVQKIARSATVVAPKIAAAKKSQTEAALPESPYIHQQLSLLQDLNSRISQDLAKTDDPTQMTEARADLIILQTKMMLEAKDSEENAQSTTEVLEKCTENKSLLIPVRLTCGANLKRLSISQPGVASQSFRTAVSTLPMDAAGELDQIISN